MALFNSKTKRNYAKAFIFFYIIPAKDKLEFKTGILPGTLFRKKVKGS